MRMLEIPNTHTHKFFEKLLYVLGNNTLMKQCCFKIWKNKILEQQVKSVKKKRWNSYNNFNSQSCKVTETNVMKERIHKLSKMILSLKPDCHTINKKCQVQ